MNYLIRLHNETLGLKYLTVTLPVGALIIILLLLYFKFELVFMHE